MTGTAAEAVRLISDGSGLEPEPGLAAEAGATDDKVLDASIEGDKLRLELRDARPGGADV